MPPLDRWDVEFPYFLNTATVLEVQIGLFLVVVDMM